MAVVCVEGMMAMIGKMRIFIYMIENIGYISTKRYIRSIIAHSVHEILLLKNTRLLQNGSISNHIIWK